MSLYTKEFSLEFLTNLVNGPMFPPEVYTAYPSHQKIITAFEKIGLPTVCQKPYISL
jgi:hypothetical protein